VLLNPEDSAIEVALGSGAVSVARARRTTLAGDTIEDLAVDAGRVRVPVAARALTRIVVAG